MRFSVLLALSPFLLDCTSEPPAEEQRSAATHLFLLRHAEQEAGAGDDPPLSLRGQQRAAYLDTLLANIPLDAVLSTPYRRNRQTAAPIARRHGLPVRTYDPDLDLQVLADSLLQAHAGQTILLVGHSTTVPGMLKALTRSEGYPPLDKSDFNDLFLVQAGSDTARVFPFQLPAF